MKGKVLSKVFILLGVLLLLLALYLSLGNSEREEKAHLMIEKAREEAEAFIEEGKEESPCLGLIEIPSCEINLPIFKEFSEDNLSIAPCLQKGSLEEKAVIAGHNFKGHFDTLHNMKAGEEMSITTPEGKVFNYRLKEMLKIKPTEIEKVMEAEYPLVIYTCNYSGKARLVFYFEKT